MSVDPSLDETIPLPVLVTKARKAWHVSDLLLPAAAGLWAVGISETNTTAISAYGLPPLLPIVFYAGLALVIASAAIELFSDGVSSWRMALHATVLTVMLYGTAPLVYAAGRYAWLYKTVGVIQYVNAHGQLNGRIDIYQNWPGFFALTGWLDKTAGVATPLAYAKWAQLLFELAALPLLYLIYDALALSVRQRWVALLLVPASNWIGQDYLSPQALGTLLCLGIMAVALRVLFVPAPGPRVLTRVRRMWARVRANSPPDVTEAPGTPRRSLGRALRSWLAWPDHRSLAACAVVLVISFVLAMTHQLSPYMIAAQLGALAVFRMLRPWWLPVAILAIAIGYLLPHFSYVNNHYGLLNSLGNLFSNATPPALTRTQAARSQRFIEHCAELLSIGIWLLAIVGAWRGRRSAKTTFALLLLAFSPALMLGLQAYGHEGVLRVFLFSLPWAAALAAMAIAPVREAIVIAPAREQPVDEAESRDLQALRVLMTMGTAVGEAVGEAAGEPVSQFRQVTRSVGGRLRALGRYIVSDAVRAVLALGITLALFFPAFFGDDSSNFMSPSEVDVLTSFFQTAPPGRIYSPLDNAPLADTSSYDLFPRYFLFGSYGALKQGILSPNAASKIAKVAWQASSRTSNAYLVITPSMVAFNEQYEVTPARNFGILRASLANSPFWKSLYDSNGITIYQLLPRPG